MKILYSLPATGSGHITRCNELLNDLKKIGDVDIFIGGQNSFLLNKLPFKPKYTSKGLSLFYSNDGSFNYSKLISQRNVINLFNEIKDIPIEKYDLIINDFEGITSLACQLKKVPCIQFGHQASFNFNNIKKPKGNFLISELVMKYFAYGKKSVGIHFKNYDRGIFYPIIKRSILKGKYSKKNFTLVYLPQYENIHLSRVLKKIFPYKFKIFSSSVDRIYEDENLTWYPASIKKFDEFLLSCNCVITGGGFETPAETLYLNKKLISIPIKNHFEQLSNSECLKDIGVKVLNDVKDLNFNTFDYEFQKKNNINYKYIDQKNEMIEVLYSFAKKI